MISLTHLRCRRMLDALVDDELSQRHRGRVEQHLVRCPMCLRDAALTRLIKASLTNRGMTNRGMTNREMTSGAT